MTPKPRAEIRPNTPPEDLPMTAFDTNAPHAGTAGRNPRCTVAEMREADARFQRRVAYGFLVLGVLAIALFLAFATAWLEADLEARLAAVPAGLSIMEAERLLVGGTAWQYV